MHNLAIIPARSGTKGLKDKNIKQLDGKPLLAYTIEAALDSGMFAEIHVSTDSNDYAEVAKEYGAKVPFLRPVELATDESDTWETVRYVIKTYKSLGWKFDTIALLQPTSPLRRANHIKEAYNLYIKNNANSVMSVCEVEHSPLWSNVLPENFSLKDFILPENDLRRQDLPTYYRQNGAIYIEDVDLIINRGNLLGDASYAYIMDKRSSIDIDDDIDFAIAELLLKNTVTKIKNCQ